MAEPQTKSEPPTLPYSWQNAVPPITMHYIRDYDEANLRVSELKPGPFGFDLEWKPSFKKGQRQNRVALVQLANHETILLIQVSAMKGFPELLKAVLEDSAYIKAGTGIQDDSKKIHFDYGIDMKNCVDLALLARSVDSQWKGRYTSPLGLARLVAVYENLVLVKGKIARTDWEALLDESQKEYASNDAHSGFTLYSRLIGMANTMDPIPEPFYYSYNVVRGLFCTHSGDLWLRHNPYYDPGPPPLRKVPKSEGRTVVDVSLSVSDRSIMTTRHVSRRQMWKPSSVRGTEGLHYGRDRVPIDPPPRVARTAFLSNTDFEATTSAFAHRSDFHETR